MTSGLLAISLTPFENRYGKHLEPFTSFFYPNFYLTHFSTRVSFWASNLVLIVKTNCLIFLRCFRKISLLRCTFQLVGRLLTFWQSRSFYNLLHSLSLYYTFPTKYIIKTYNIEASVLWENEQRT